MSHKPGPLPNFLIVGASRSGTTSLHHYLEQHPQVFMGHPKEVRFFERDGEYGKGLDAYRRAFARWQGEPAIGEASPSYFARGVLFGGDRRYRFDEEDDAARRIARHLPDARILISLRNPVRRAYSLFWKNRQQGREAITSFRGALEEELSGRRSPQVHGGCMVYKNRYSIHVPHWLEHFGAERVKILVFEEWTRAPAAALRDVAGFLGIDTEAAGRISYEVRNKGWRPRSRLVSRLVPRLGGMGKLLKRANRKRGYPPMDKETATFAQRLFAEDVEAIEKLVGRELHAWRTVTHPARSA